MALVLKFFDEMRQDVSSDDFNKALDYANSEQGIAEQDEIQEATELCAFCKSHERASCLKCLLGGSSKKIVRFGENGNIHGFGN